VAGLRAAALGALVVTRLQFGGGGQVVTLEWPGGGGRASGEVVLGGSPMRRWWPGEEAASATGRAARRRWLWCVRQGGGGGVCGKERKMTLWARSKKLKMGFAYFQARLYSSVIGGPVMAALRPIYSSVN
jgi:hypothetical protein